MMIYADLLFMENKIRKKDKCSTKSKKLDPSNTSIIKEIYLFKEFLSTLDRTDQIAYYHFLTGIPMRTTSVIVNLPEKIIHEIVLEINMNWSSFAKEMRHVILKPQASFFFKQIYNNDDENIAEVFGYELAVIMLLKAALKIDFFNSNI